MDEWTRESIEELFRRASAAKARTKQIAAVLKERQRAEDEAHRRAAASKRNGRGSRPRSARPAH